MAFNLTVLSNLLGTPLEPDFSGVDLLIEDVGEQLYRIDRTMFHVASSANVRRVSRLRLGRVSDVLSTTPNLPVTRLRLSRIGAAARALGSAAGRTSATTPKTGLSRLGAKRAQFPL